MTIPPKTKKLFISYRSSDAAKVDKIARDLVSLTHEDGTPRYITWQDKHNLPPASPNWWDAIVDAIENCDIFVFHLSRESLQSPVCRAELDYAHKRNRPIIPLVLDGEFFIKNDKPDLPQEVWTLVPAWLRDRQFLFYVESEFEKSFKIAVSVFERNWPNDIYAAHPLNPDETSAHASNYELYDAACEYAERLAFDEAEKRFNALVSRNDRDFAHYAAQWIEIIRKYAELLEIASRRNVHVILKARVAEYRALFPNTATTEIFDPKNIASREPTPEEIAAEKAKQEQMEREKAEAERIAREKTEKERLAREKAEAERIAREKTEKERLAREKAEVERIAAEKAEADRIAHEKAENERIAAQKKHQQVEDSLRLVESALKNGSTLEALEVWNKLDYKQATTEQVQRKNQLYETYVIQKKGNLQHLNPFNPLNGLRFYMWVFFKYQDTVARYAWENEDTAEYMWGWLISNMLLLPLLVPIVAVHLKILKWPVDESLNNWLWIASVGLLIIFYIISLALSEDFGDDLGEVYVGGEMSVFQGAFIGICITGAVMLAGLNLDSAIIIIILLASVVIFANLNCFMITSRFTSDANIPDGALIGTAGVVFTVLISQMNLANVNNWDSRFVIGTAFILVFPFLLGLVSLFSRSLTLSLFLSVIFSAGVTYTLVSFNIVYIVSAIGLGIVIGGLLGFLLWVLVSFISGFTLPRTTRENGLFVFVLRVVLSLVWPVSFASLIYTVFF